MDVISWTLWRLRSHTTSSSSLAQRMLLSKERRPFLCSSYQPIRGTNYGHFELIRLCSLIRSTETTCVVLATHCGVSDSLWAATFVYTHMCGQFRTVISVGVCCDYSRSLWEPGSPRVRTQDVCLT